MAGNVWGILHGLKPTMVMIFVQIVFAGLNVLYKLAANDGMSLMILVAYRHILATAVVAPLAWLFERRSRPKLTWTVVFQAFLCGLFGGSLSQTLYVASLVLTSVTFTSAMSNLGPAVTFIMAVLFRMEWLSLRTTPGKVKVLGTMLGIVGAMILTLYKGVEVHIWSTNIDILRHSHEGGGHTAKSNGDSGNRVLGSFLAAASCFSYAIWLIIQTKMSERYPCHYSSTTLMMLMGSIQSVVFALCIEKAKWERWRLGWNIRLLTAVYSGTAAFGLVVTLISWCVRLKGPVFVSVFNPLVLVILVVVGTLVLGEKLYLGSVLGSVLIIGGLYMVLWGKLKEAKALMELMLSKSSREAMEVVVVDSSPQEENDKGCVNNLSANDNNNTVIASDGRPIMTFHN